MTFNHRAQATSAVGSSFHVCPGWHTLVTLSANHVVIYHSMIALYIQRKWHHTRLCCSPYMMHVLTQWQQELFAQPIVLHTLCCFLRCELFTSNIVTHHCGTVIERNHVPAVTEGGDGDFPSGSTIVTGSLHCLWHPCITK